MILNFLFQDILIKINKKWRVISFISKSLVFTMIVDLAERKNIAMIAVAIIN